MKIDATEPAKTKCNNILFVDDEQHIINALKRLFRTQEYNIFTAQSGSEGLSILEKNDISIVVSDMKMPEMMGDEFLENVHKLWPETVRILLTGQSDLSSTINAINKGNIFSYVSKPWDDNQLKTLVKQAKDHIDLKLEKERLVYVTQQQNKTLEKLNDVLEQKVEERTQSLSKALSDLNVTHDQLKNNFVSTIKVFSSLLELRENTAHPNTRKMADHARSIALELGLSEKDAQDILFACILQNIGKIALPDKFLLKSERDMSSQELKVYREYPIIGQEILMGLPQLREVATIIRNHREHLDGTGYPEKLKGSILPVGSQIICFLNHYYEQLNKTKSESETLKFLKSKSNHYFDEAIFTAWQAIIDRQKNENQQSIKYNKIKTKDLKPGFKLWDDIVTEKGVILIAKDQTIDDKVIQSLMKYEARTDECLDISITK